MSDDHTIAMIDDGGSGMQPDLESALDDALDRALGIGDDTAPTHHCLRCGHWWTPRAGTLAAGGPRECALCHSHYWDRPPRYPHAGRPERTDRDELRRRKSKGNLALARRRKAARIIRTAKALGLTLYTSTGRLAMRLKSVEKAVEADKNIFIYPQSADIFLDPKPAKEPAPQDSAPAAAAIPAAPKKITPEWLSRRAYGTTVPPPPGAEGT